MTSRRIYRYTTHVPVSRDSNLFADQTDRMFRDMQLRMDPDLHWNNTFYSLSPSRPLAGSRELLADTTASGDVFVEDPKTKNRLFRMTFDVKNYDPNDIKVRAEDGFLIVEAKQDAKRSGSTGLTTEFSRRIELPPEVEADKITSTVSSDGVLTVQAQCPPKTTPSGAAGAPGHTTEVTPIKSQIVNVQHARSGGGPGGSVVIPVMSAPPGNLPVDTPTFTPMDDGRRRLDLVVDLGKKYAARDVIVKLDGRKIEVEATHEEKQQGRTCKTSMQREFDLSEDVDPATVFAAMKTDDQLIIIGATGAK